MYISASYDSDAVYLAIDGTDGHSGARLRCHVSMPRPMRSRRSHVFDAMVVMVLAVLALAVSVTAAAVTTAT